MWTVLLAGVLAAPQGHDDHEIPGRNVQTVVDQVRPFEASGTAWQPALTPQYAIHSRLEDWNLMTHAAVFAAYDYQTGRRGEDAFMSTNWIMLMGHRALGEGEFFLRGMASLEAFTVGDRGYPLLLQSGEGLHDRQHPHDLIMELAAGWSTPVSPRLGFQAYAGIVGEPALGPVTFHHRHSASADPASPLGHHWMDATHISHGVLTAGVFTRAVKVEASWFNGREPDDNRTDLDLDVPDSGSFRVSVNPDPGWSMQFSSGHLAEPEEDEPGVSVTRTTASVTGTGRMGAEGVWSAMVAWGRNDPTGGKATDALLVEGTFEIDRVHAVYGRAEAVWKSGHDLDLGPGLEGEIFPTPSLSAGYLYTFTELLEQELSLGVRLTANFIDGDLRDFYGDAVEWGFMLYVRLRPARISRIAPPGERK